jgi:hypothetical protein
MPPIYGVEGFYNMNNCWLNVAKEKVTNTYLTQLVLAIQSSRNNGDSPAQRECLNSDLNKALTALSKRVINYFIRENNRKLLIDKRDIVKECLIKSFDELEYFDPKQVTAHHFFVRIMINMVKKATE